MSADLEQLERRWWQLHDASEELPFPAEYLVLGDVPYDEDLIAGLEETWADALQKAVAFDEEAISALDAGDDQRAEEALNRWADALEIVREAIGGLQAHCESRGGLYFLSEEPPESENDRLARMRDHQTAVMKSFADLKHRFPVSMRERAEADLRERVKHWDMLSVEEKRALIGKYSKYLPSHVVPDQIISNIPGLPVQVKAWLSEKTTDKIDALLQYSVDELIEAQRASERQAHREAARRAFKWDEQ